MIHPSEAIERLAEARKHGVLEMEQAIHEALPSLRAAVEERDRLQRAFVKYQGACAKTMDHLGLKDDESLMAPTVKVLLNELHEQTEENDALRAQLAASQAEVARLRDIISPGAAAEYEEGMAAMQAKVAALKEERDEALAKQAIDERQCDDVTSEAGKMAQELAEARRRGDAWAAALREADYRWSFGELQEHTHTWHTREDWRERHREALEAAKETP